MLNKVAGKILIKETELNLKMMLAGGQSFRWTELVPNSWSGVICNLLWILKQSPDSLEYEAIGLDGSDDVERTIRKYLRLDEDIKSLYAHWSKRDSHFEKVSSKFPGIRLLCQDPVENLFSFICSSNNNITRISSMVEKLCSLYGNEICIYEGKTYYGFPQVKSLTQPGVEELRKAGFGYRAKYIYESAKQLDALGGERFLEDLKAKSYTESKLELLKFTGIGPKVADCICLMSLGHLGTIPVDTHVFQIAREHYMPSLKLTKNVNDKIYKMVGDLFKEIYGESAGWAHLVLFCSDLRENRVKEGTKRKKEMPQNKNKNRKKAK
ncbi:N-glycosylase/DNA lyase isoform X2 [Cimex lectularius]|uniref:N-glycosylase/DNA lyase n=1 Tax=Cimex lectularius TaxID=79782 RepID=A0A8I6TE81_CIMLE|nr:N-glycosylase/DNA lyase isoform X2 [Cimex lectularius]